MVEHEVRSWVDRVSLAISRVAMFFTAVIVLIMFYEVVMRYVFESPTLWVNEMSLWIAGALYLSAGLYVMQQRAHIRVFVIYDMFPRSLQRVCDTISTLAIVAFAFAIIWGAFWEAWQKMMRWETFGTAWDPPIPATIKPLFLVLITLTALQAVANLIMDWNDEKHIHTPADDIDEMPE